MRTCVKCEKELDDEQFVYGKVTRRACRACFNIIRRESATKYKETAESIKKTCTSCNTEKCGTEFAYSMNICKKCRSEENKEEKHRPAADAPPKSCTKCVKEQPAIQFRYQSKVCLTCEKERLYEWRKENTEKFKAICKTYRDKPEHKEHRKDYLRTKYNEDINFRLEHLYRNRIRYFIRGGSKSGREKYLEMLGCSWDTLREWIQSNFDEGMTWENYGSVWHIDHTMPCSVFDFNIDENRKTCFNWTNLAPMMGVENMSKSNKIDMTRIAKMKDLAHKFLLLHKDQIVPTSLPAEFCDRNVVVLDTKVSLKDGTGE